MIILFEKVLETMKSKEGFSRKVQERKIKRLKAKTKLYSISLNTYIDNFKSEQMPIDSSATTLSASF